MQIVKFYALALFFPRQAIKLMDQRQINFGLFSKQFREKKLVFAVVLFRNLLIKSATLLFYIVFWPPCHAFFCDGTYICTYFAISNSIVKFYVPIEL
jgi:hypothetical protein